MFIEQIKDIVNQVHTLKKDKNNTLPDNSYFLPGGGVLCYPRKYGDSRYPYYNDGLVMFAHTNGYIDISEGMFNIFRTANYNEDTVIGFFAGEKQGDDYFPISVTGAARQLFEPQGLTRYTVFTPSCVYYITESEDAIYALRAYVDSDKHIRFTIGTLNLSNEREIYLASFFEPMLRYIEAEGFFNRMTKYGKRMPNGNYIMRSLNACFDCLSVRTEITGNVVKKFHTTGKKTFLGYKGRCLTNAECLKNGRYDKEDTNTNTTDLPVVSDMVHFRLKKDEWGSIDYEMLVTDDELSAETFSLGRIDIEGSEKQLCEMIRREPSDYDSMKMNFEGWEDERIGSGVLNNFLEYVKRQVSLCALGKNYAGNMLGIRDVFQQLESCLIWQSEKSRAQIVRVMNYMLEDGRPPRQISFPTAEKPIPDMDLRPYIDQGPWIIETLHTYLAYTGDSSILDEECSYYKAEGTFGPLSLSDRKDSLLSHITAICDYLVSKIDADTGCLRALWGDWNDALDGLGRTNDKDKEFGSGVSVMATAQLYSALGKTADILETYTSDSQKAAEYRRIQASLGDSYRKYAVCEENSKKRILHGWGDKRSYYVGSYEDYDGKSRISLTANAFYAISGISREYPELAKDIVDNILSLDSKYGLLTFDEAFDKFASEVGRISTITVGTYENSAAYVHAGTFGIMALFLLGESEAAWKQIEKSMVITHDNATMSTFVMPNSYCRSDVYAIDGESMGDWYTGSGTVLLKELVKYGFGIEPALNGVKITPSSYFPCEKAELKVRVKGSNITVSVQGKGRKDRRIYLDGEDITESYDEQMRTNTAFIPMFRFKDEMNITIE